MAEPAADTKAKAAPMDPFWNDEQSDRGVSEPLLVVDVQGFEGPLDLLLHLARTQKVDLAKISVLALTEQYLDFIEQARQLRLELAADYLVMAAWLAYLKSKLLIPEKDDGDGASAEELAAILQFRLKRLEAIRDAAGRLANRNRLGREFYARGMPEAVVLERKSRYSASLFDLLSAYASQRQRNTITNVQIARRQVWSLKEARSILVRMIGSIGDWACLDTYLIEYVADPEDRRSALASSFAASLEMVREGLLDIRQEKTYAPIYMRARSKTTKQGVG
jgi:segregation and condensation protein A